MEVVLSGEDERLVRQEIASGRYGSAREVLREALRLLQEQLLIDETRRVRLTEQIREGMVEIGRGEGIPADQVFASLRARSRQRREAS